MAGFLAYTKTKGPFRYLTVPPFTPYTSPLLRSPINESQLHQGNSPINLLIKALEEDLDAIRLHLHPSLADVRAFNWSGWNATPLYTYSVSLNKNPLENWSESAKRRFRQHHAEYSIVASDNLDDAVSLSQSSYARHQRPFPIERKKLLSFIQLLQPSVYYAISIKEKRPEASIVLLRQGKTAYYWVAGSIPGNAMTVLLGHLFSELPSTGIQFFDMIGANTPTIAEFKRRLGGELQSYYAVEKIPNKWFQLVRAIRGR